MTQWSFVRSVALSLFVGSTLLYGQGTSSLRGTITDVQKAVVPDAKVTITAESTGISRSTISRERGQYEFPAVAPGSYTLFVEKPGFALTKQADVRLLVDTPVTQDVTLQIGTATQTVAVIEEAAQLNTTDASLGNAFQQKQIQDLPIQTRNAVQLLSLQPGVTQNGEVMGARRDQNNITLDGIDINDNQNALSNLNGNSQGGTPSPTATGSSATSPPIGFNAALPVPLDSVMEFRVTVAGQGAAQGYSSGGQVSLVTRSGTNDLHGTAYEYNRNTAYTANNWFNNRSGLGRPQLVRNQFGASLGGPVKKDRAFFFLNYERRIDSSAQTQNRNVPSETLKQGLMKFQLSDGTTQTLTPSQIRQVDPLQTGVSPAMLTYLQQFPAGNNPAGGADGGLNFTQLLFNAPVKLDYRTYVGRFDYILDAQGKHALSFRGTLSNQGQTQTAAQLPGQSAAQQILADNRGFGLRYTATLTPSLVNVANVGLTRIGYANTGTIGTGLTFGNISSVYNYNNSARPNNRINPTWNVGDDVTWTKGSHTITGGFNFRFIDNSLVNYSNSYPNYSFSRGLLLGLGNDINTAVLNYAAGSNTSLKLSNGTAVTNAMGDLLGLIDSVSVTYQFQKTGTALALGQPLNTDFITHNYEFYVQDTWKVNSKLTLTYGLRYQNDTPPYEASGLQVNSTPTVDQYFGSRVYAMNNGIPANQLPGGDRLSYSLNGPVNGTSSWFKRDTNNFSPRLSFAYSLNKSTVIRGGGAMVYDQYGNDLVAQYSSLGSVGLSSTLGFPGSYDFTTSPRYTGSSLPALPAAPAGGFPYTPPDVHAITTTLYGISPNLVAPYSYLLNATVSHQFKNSYTLDVGYVGRLSHKLLLQQDVNSPLIYFKDPKSGQTWVQNDTAMRQLYNNGNGLTAAQAMKNPSSVPNSAFVENMFPGLANYYFPGSASANYFYGIYGKNAGSNLDNLHQLDRVQSTAFPNCIVVTGCFTFFAPQASADPAWTNAGNANYHALILTVRRPLSKGFAFDFNYTWSHSIDNGSTAASGTTQFGGVLENAFLPGANRGASDFDLRHQFNANLLYQLPFGKGKQFFSSAPGWMDQIIGGWQISSLIRVQSGLPSTITGDGVYGTNYWQSSLAIPNGAPLDTGGVKTDGLGNPSLFSAAPKVATGSYQDAYPGGVGERAIVRMPWQRNVDVAVKKEFKLPGTEKFSHSLEFRGEAFNVFNFVNFTTVSLSLASPGIFGEFQTAADARVLQLALRYSF
jgi:hypothetical protein